MAATYRVGDRYPWQCVDATSWILRKDFKQTNRCIRVRACAACRGGGWGLVCNECEVFDQRRTKESAPFSSS